MREVGYNGMGRLKWLYYLDYPKYCIVMLLLHNTGRVQLSGSGGRGINGLVTVGFHLLSELVPPHNYNETF